MPENGVMSNQEDLTAQKVRAELEKLRAENAAIRTPFWRTPTFLLAIGGLALSLFGNLVQFGSSKAAAAIAQGQLQLATSRWNGEREKLGAEVEALRQRNRVAVEDRSAVQAELFRLEKEASTWDSAVIKQSLDLKMLEADLARYESSKRNEMVKSTKDIIASTKELIQSFIEKRDASLRRRSELERRLGC